MGKQPNGNGHSNGHGVKGRGGALWMTRSYNNVEKNPEIDKFRTRYQRVHIKEDDLAALAGLSTSTVKNMFGGQTKDPRASTFQKLAPWIGCEYKLIDLDKSVNYEKEIPKAKEERKLYRIALVKKRERSQARAG